MPQPTRRRRQNPADRDPDQLLTIPEACSLLRMGRSWMYCEINKGSESKVPFVRVGRYVRFRRSALLDWLRQEQRGGGR